MVERVKEFWLLVSGIPLGSYQFTLVMIIWLVVFLFLIDMFSQCKGLFVPKRSFRRGFGRFSSHATEYAITRTVTESLLTLSAVRPQLKIVQSSSLPIGAMSGENIVWASFRGDVQVDACVLEGHFLGQNELSSDSTAELWNQVLKIRQMAPKLSSITYASCSKCYNSELDVAVNIVQRAANIIRSLQTRILGTSISKSDNTPVTIVDLAVQALIIDTLSTAFSTDRFIAEEDSSLVRSNDTIREKVLNILEYATGEIWQPSRLYAALDRGQPNAAEQHRSGDVKHCDASGANSSASSVANSSVSRVWVLDPIDGTKGFLRGEHCCTALGLLVDGKAVLSVLGCPNLNLQRVLESDPATVSDICAIDPPWRVNSDLSILHPDGGSVFFAVSGQGAYARSLGMAPGAAYEVTTSGVTDTPQARLCESAEAGFGDRVVTTAVVKSLKVQRDYTHIDGMCKHCLVGVGAVEATLRLPPAGYREKIWDHVAGDHFVREAGGRVTDLRGNQLDYTAVLLDTTTGAAGGRELSADVQGVVISNGVLHERILSAVQQARLEQSHR